MVTNIRHLNGSLLDDRTRTFRIPLFLCFVVAGCTAVRTRAAQPATEESLPKIRIVLAGDSTVSRGTGWGTGFAAALSDRAEVINLARPGRSSANFISQGLLQKCLDAKPDYVLIQFGHNDQRLVGSPGGTEPQTSYRKCMSQYVDDARAAGIKPVLVTSLSRRIWGADGKIHSNLQAYVDVVKEIAAEKNVPLIDLHARSIELYEKLGEGKVNALSAKRPSTDPSAAERTTVDATHLNAKGGIMIGRIVADELGMAVKELSSTFALKRPA
jgi:lysophospholipase L1-like esterase